MKIKSMKISVCMATYNGEKYIKEQLDSIIPQLTDQDEIIISDDGSTDKTCDIIESYSDPRIKLVKNLEKSASKIRRYKTYVVTRNFENSLQFATGDYIFLADQDDIWEDTKVSHLCSLLSDDLDLIVHDARVVDENGDIISSSYFQILHSQKGFVKNIAKNSYLGCCMVFNKKTLCAALPFPKALVAHDMWIGLIGEKIGKVLFLDKKLIQYRRHSSTATTSGKKSHQKLIFRMQYRFELIIQYIERVILLKFGKDVHSNQINNERINLQ